MNRIGVKLFGATILLFVNACLLAQSSTIKDSMLNVIKNSTNDSLKINAYTQLFTLQYKELKIKDALQTANGSLSFALSTKNKKAIADAYNNVGIANSELGNMKEAKKYYLLSLETRKEINDRKGMARTYSNLGNIHSKMGLFPLSIQYFIESIKIREEIKDSNGLASNYNLLGMTSREMGNMEESINYFNNAMSYYTLQKNEKQVAAVLNGLGNTYLQTKDLDSALVCFTKALSINNKLQENIHASFNRINIAATQIELGKSSYLKGDSTTGNKFAMAAYFSFKQLMEDSTAFLNEYQLYDVSLQAVDACILYKKYDEAILYAEKSIAISKKTEKYNILVDAFSALADAQKAKALTLTNSVQEMKSLLLKSISNYNLSRELRDSLFNEDNTNQIAEIKTKYETEKKDNEIVLLNKEKEVQKLYLAQQHAALLLSQLESEKNNSKIVLLNKNKEVQELTLNNTQQKLSQRELEAKTQTAEIQLMQQNKLINESELAQQKFWRNGLLVGLIFLMVVSVLLYNRFQLRKKIEHQQVVLNERKRISNELHDDLGSGLSTIRFLSEVAKAQAKDVHSKNQLEKISDVSNDLVDNMKQIVWTLNVEENTLENLILDLKKYVNDYLDTNNLALQLQVPEIFPNRKLSSETRRNIFLVVKECLHNTVKHADATEVNLDVEINEKVKFVLKDNGKGFNIEQRSNTGNGLSNMRNRMLASNGTFEIQNKIGTTVTLTF